MSTVTIDVIPPSLIVVVSIRAATYAEAVTELVAQVVANPTKALVAMTHVITSPEEHFFTVYFG